MKTIEFKKWTPSADNPRQMEYAGQRTAQEVFEELKHRLESQGYLPDEYFLMDNHWEDSREIPKDADIFCTTDYGGSDHQAFVDCFVTYEERTRTVTVTNEDGAAKEQEETYNMGIPIEDLAAVYQNIAAAMGITVTEDQKANADSIYNLIRYGAATGGSGFAGSDVPFIGADGFCSPVGPNRRNVVTSEFGYRKDPFTGQSKGHGGIDLGVPTGTSVRAALPGTVTVCQYSSSYGYYVMIDHGGGLSTLYAHNSKLLVKVGQTVNAGDVVSLSGSTGRSTGPHVHFEVRMNGERTNPRSYLP